jgi:hypothetical protein
MDALIDIQAVAAEAFATLDIGRQIEPFSSTTAGSATLWSSSNCM